MGKISTQPSTDKTHGIKIFNDTSDQDLTAVISSVCADALQVAQESWGLAPPRDCRIHVMTSWQQFYKQATPWYYLPLMLISIPIWGTRAKKIWPLAGAWTQRFANRVVIGVKPPRLLEASNRTVGLILYETETDMRVKMHQLISHELTHACAARLNLPAWLNEGIAFVSMERTTGKRVVRPDTLELLRAEMPRCKPPGYRQLTKMGTQAMAMHSARGYWLVRLLEDTEPGFLKSVFSSHKKTDCIDILMAGLLKLPEESFWQQVDERILAHFQVNKG
jgi:hypothetical protein